MSTASQGRAREHKVRDYLLDRGWVLVARSAGSKGAADLVLAHHDYGLALVQVGTPSKTLGPTDRRRLLDLAEVARGLPLVAIVAPRQGITWRLVTDATPGYWPAWSPDED